MEEWWQEACVERELFKKRSEEYRLAYLSERKQVEKLLKENASLQKRLKHKQKVQQRKEDFDVQEARLETLELQLFEAAENKKKLVTINRNLLVELSNNRRELKEKEHVNHVMAAAVSQSTTRSNILEERIYIYSKVFEAARKDPRTAKHIEHILNNLSDCDDDE